MTNKEWMATLTAEEFYDMMKWLTHLYSKQFTDSRFAIIEWLNKEHEHNKKESCGYCKHLYYNCDGSVSCDSPFESVCLKSDTRMFKELSNLA